ncbi:Protein disulfide-isomerase isoform X1 [Oopsacas minuta]|uniref:Protein disulfide-isomerase n=1 Tax=Oopsacas minuta TaxID=111878 RepID=A0AAV7KBU1_9METZ|nr:Protein disulfide-isomerase isoform X1 [Oopsacas minuta]
MFTSGHAVRFVVFVGVLLFSFASSNIIEEENVLVLTTNNFDDALERYSHILVEFYAPWCGHCQALAPEYIQAATKLKEMGSEIRLAKVDATIEKDLAQSRNIKGYPTLIFFKHSSPINYNGPRKAEGIIQWLEKKTGSPTTIIDSLEQLVAFSNTDKVAIVGFFASETYTTIFMGVAGKMDKLPFGLCTNKDIFDSTLSGNDGIIIYKGFDEKKVVYNDELNATKIENFINIHQFELVSEFSQELSERFFEANIDRHLIFFAPKAEVSTDRSIDLLRSIASDFRGQILFISVDTSADQYKGIIEFFGINQDEIPCLRAVILQEDVARFKQKEPDLSEEGIRDFVTDFLSGKLKHDLKSQVVPDDWNDNPVKILTSSNFNEIIIERKSKKALVEFYAPWCGHCKALAPVWDLLGK